MRTKQFFLTLIICICFFNPSSFAKEPTMNLPKDVYVWVQSSPRMSYFFNQQWLTYALDEEKFRDLSKIEVPVIKKYDSLQATDVIEKRRWRNKSVKNFSDLAGEANYATIDLKTNKVLIWQVEWLNSKLVSLDIAHPKQILDLDKMSDKNREAIFYRAVIDYEKEHRDEMIDKVFDELRPEVQERVKKERVEREKQRKKEERRNRRKNKKQKRQEEIQIEETENE